MLKCTFVKNSNVNCSVSYFFFFFFAIQFTFMFKIPDSTVLHQDEYDKEMEKILFTMAGWYNSPLPVIFFSPICFKRSNNNSIKIAQNICCQKVVKYFLTEISYLEIAISWKKRRTRGEISSNHLMCLIR